MGAHVRRPRGGRPGCTDCTVAWCEPGLRSRRSACDGTGDCPADGLAWAATLRRHTAEPHYDAL
jgi:hypothetical protein